jgi:hypothetical protein
MEFSSPSSRRWPPSRKTLMNALNQFLADFFTRRSNAAAARSLLERADQARGLSPSDAHALRKNALAMLRVVR